MLTRFVYAPLSRRAFAFLLPEGVGSSMLKEIVLSRYFLTSNPRAAAALTTQGSSFLTCWQTNPSLKDSQRTCGPSGCSCSTCPWMWLSTCVHWTNCPSACHLTSVEMTLHHGIGSRVYLYDCWTPFQSHDHTPSWPSFAGLWMLSSGPQHLGHMTQNLWMCQIGWVSNGPVLSGVLPEGLPGNVPFGAPLVRV